MENGEDEKGTQTMIEGHKPPEHTGFVQRGELAKLGEHLPTYFCGGYEKTTGNGIFYRFSEQENGRFLLSEMTVGRDDLKTQVRRTTEEEADGAKELNSIGLALGKLDAATEANVAQTLREIGFDVRGRDGQLYSTEALVDICEGVLMGKGTLNQLPDVLRIRHNIERILNARTQRAATEALRSDLRKAA